MSTVFEHTAPQTRDFGIFSSIRAFLGSFASAARMLRLSNELMLQNVSGETLRRRLLEEMNDAHH
ncbi:MULTISPECIES: hypothetical protein [Thioclava]|jgi:hypothetical protein|uniref:hypothetical protein n=1 Tax=Thioclava TaxID=285107 RepID=UPI0023A8F1AC|nr:MULTISPECIES: hypothetical protein [Thioclava]|tara:strand:- start:474 stop:668 length:195 start_codon:yes stop_codon:yes gene_type:complete